MKLIKLEKQREMKRVPAKERNRKVKYGEEMG